MPESDDNAAEQHRSLHAQDPVGDPASRQRDQIDHGRVQSVDGSGRFGGHPESGHFVDQKQHQNGAHSVVAETFPKLREKQRFETGWMS